MSVINWLLTSDSYVQLAVRKNILNQSKLELNALRSSVLSDYRIKKYLNDVADFNSILVTNHKNPDLPIHKLIFLLDIGLEVDVPEISLAVQKIIQNRNEDGIPRSMTNVSKHFGGSGEDILGWALCDAPLMLYALIKAGADYESEVKKGFEYIVGLYRSNGFPCTVSKELGRFRGPGRKVDCCPYATFITLKLISLIPDYKQSSLANSIIDVLLGLWEVSQQEHPYMFYMGNDFRKLKAPSLWYDIVSFVDCLSNFEYAKKDKRFQEMLDIIENKANSDYQFVPESIYRKCSEWDFGQKKIPSPWLTFLCVKILERCNRLRFNQ